MELIKQNFQTKLIKSIFAVVLGSILLTISAKVKIPFYPVPMTMQTFVVLLLGLSFGYKIGLSAVGLYLLEGIFGLPVFFKFTRKRNWLSLFYWSYNGLLNWFFICLLSCKFCKIK
jgi:biotin transport system substrate-specific component